MNKHTLQKLVDVSFKNNSLDEKTVIKIASYLTRKEFKEYIKALKAYEKKTHVYISSARNLNSQRTALQKLFPKKTLVFSKDPTLIVGARIVEDDIIYELNLQHSLSELGEFIYE